MEIDNDNYSSNLISHLEEGEDFQFKRKGPKIVKNYILGEVLGEGAYGKVKDGLDTFTQKRVAVKILKRVRLKKIPGGEASVFKEINITKKLHSKHVIKLIDHFTIDSKGKLYIVYEYVGGGSLQNLLESSPMAKLPLAQAQNIFNQLVDAIEYIHSQKILHRDIKPDNILFTNDNILKLTDFGVSEDSSQLDDFECLSRSYGSPAFQPPELTSFQRSFSPFKIDIWAMGVTLYLMTVGKFPFHGTNMYMLFENISKCNIEFPQDIDKDLCSLIKGILQIDHNQRFTIDQIKKHIWCTKLIESKEPFIPLPQESKFDALEMAYGDEEDLIFGYEQGDNENHGNSHHHHHHHQQQQNYNEFDRNVPINLGSSIPTIPPPTINLTEKYNNCTNNQNNTYNNNSNNLYDDSELIGDLKNPLSNIPKSASQVDIIHDYVNLNHLHYQQQKPQQQQNELFYDIPTIVASPNSLPQPQFITSSTTTTTTLLQPQQTMNANSKPLSLSSNAVLNRQGSDSPPPPLRNSSVRRPKITFESPHNKSKCIVQ